MVKYKILKRTAIRKPKRTAILHVRNKEGLYEGMPGTINVYGRIFKLPTKQQTRAHGIAVRRRMYVCFGRTSNITKEEVIELKQERLEYLNRFRKTINVINQILSTKEERNALLSSKLDVGGVQDKTPGHTGTRTKSSRPKVRSSRKKYYRRK